MMGQIANTVAGGGGKVIGIIPEFMHGMFDLSKVILADRRSLEQLLVRTATVIQAWN